MKVNKFVIIGCGYVSSLYMDSYLNDKNYKKNFQLIGCFDIDKIKALNFSKFYKCKRFNSTSEIINEKPELILILTSIDSHFKLSKYFLKQKINVFCEKPPAKKYNQFLELNEISKKNNVRYSFAPCNHLNAQIKFIKKKINSRKLGNLEHIHLNYKAGINLNNKPWNWKNTFGSKWPALEEFKHGVFEEHALYLIRILNSIVEDTLEKINVIKSCDLMDKKIIKNTINDNYLINLKFKNYLARLELGLFFEKKMFIKIYFKNGYIYLKNFRNEKLPIYIFEYKNYKNFFFKVFNKFNFLDFRILFCKKKKFYNKFANSQKYVDYFAGVYYLLTSNQKTYERIKLEDDKALSLYFDLKNF